MVNQDECNTLLCATMELNERGVQLLVSGGQDKEAVGALAQSLGIVKQLLTSLEEDEDDVESMDTDDDEDEFDYISEELLQDEPIKMFTLPNFRQGQQEQQDTNNTSASDETFVYDKVMALNYMPPTSSPEEDSHPNGSNNVNVIKLHAGCVVYNLALAHHRRAMMMNSCLNKAKQLYSMVDKLLPTDYDFTTTDSGLCNSKMTPHELEVTFLLKLASLNNMAHIQYEQGLYDEAQLGLREIAHLMYQVEEVQQQQQQQEQEQKRTTTSVATTNVRSLIQIHEWDGIVLNILLLTPPTIAAAA